MADFDGIRVRIDGILDSESGAPLLFPYREDFERASRNCVRLVVRVEPSTVSYADLHGRYVRVAGRYRAGTDESVAGTIVTERIDAMPRSTRRARD